MNDRQIEPFSNQKCSVCNGFATLGYKKIPCHACKGRGFIIIDNSTGYPVEEIEREKYENEDSLS